MGSSQLLYKSSNLPSILDTYKPSNLSKQDEAKQKKKIKPLKRCNNSHILSDDDGDDTRKAAQEQRHLETYKNMYRFRDSLYQQYLAMLNKKVHNQHCQIQMCDLNFQRKKEILERKTGVPAHHYQYCKLSSDNKYLESIPKSNSYLIISMENELSRSGILKSRRDHEQFHQLVHHNKNLKLKMTLQDIKSKMATTKSISSHQISKNELETINLVNISELSHPRKDSEKYLSQKRYSKMHDEISQMIPKLLSRLSEFQMNQEMKNTHKDLKPQNRGEKYSNQHNYIQQLHQMYYLSLSNMASSRRLLEKNGQFADFEEHSVRDLLDHLYPNENQKTDEKHSKTLQIVGPEQMQGDISKSKLHKEKNTESVLCKTEVTKEIAEQPSQCPNGTTQERVPLSMDEIRINYPSLESVKTKYWVNYTNKQEEATIKF
ncbi:uncharacterized protein LOC128656900 [Bombina bombina]|uniref:uncharacterized protein LOC128656900 n=1 Tax=Bombina bombina TaxID=8345 RepID=UPI00235A8EAF|nr:uncharacterized protein LOC128656900 [Bombina bombina]